MRREKQAVRGEVKKRMTNWLEILRQRRTNVLENIVDDARDNATVLRRVYIRALMRKL